MRRWRRPVCAAALAGGTARGLKRMSVQCCKNLGQEGQGLYWKRLVISIPAEETRADERWGPPKSRTFTSTRKGASPLCASISSAWSEGCIVKSQLCPGFRHSSAPHPRTHVIQRGLRRLALTFIFTRSVPTQHQLHTSQYGTGSLGILLPDLGKEFCIPLKKMRQEGRVCQR